MSSTGMITLHITPALAQRLLLQLKQQLPSQPSQPIDDDTFAEEDPHWRDHLPEPF